MRTHTITLEVTTVFNPIVEDLFRKAIQLAGSETRLAKAIGFSQHAVWHARRKGKPSAEMAAAIDRFTEGKVSRRELRPDLWE